MTRPLAGWFARAALSLALVGLAAPDATAAEDPLAPLTTPAKAKPKAAPKPAAKQPAAAPAPAPEPAAPPPPAPEPKTETRTIEAFADPKPVAPAPEPARTEAVAPSPLGLSLGAAAGISAPFSRLSIGPRAGLFAQFRLWGPIAAQLAIAWERHAGSFAAQIPPPAGGFDAAAVENQDLVPVELGPVVDLYRAGENAVFAGASYGLLVTTTRTNALGSEATESGVGHQIAIEAGYERSLGAVLLFGHARWAVRRTAVGKRTSALELPWYQTAGVVVGVGYSL